MHTLGGYRWSDYISRMIPPTNWLASLSSSAFCLLPPGLGVDRLLPAGDHLVLETHATSPSATCPLCDQLSTRRHSTYCRRLADLPWQGRIVELHLRIRRFRCANIACPRRLFAERLPEVTVPKARRTIRLRDLQQQIGLALGGEQGSWLAGRLSMPLSAATVLRLIRAIDLKPPGTPRVIGVDDWAFRRGQHYGTIICDLEQPRTLELLPDRQAATLEAWLKAHPLKAHPLKAPPLKAHPSCLIALYGSSLFLQSPFPPFPLLCCNECWP